MIEGVIIVKNNKDNATHGIFRKERFSDNGIIDRMLENIKISQTKKNFDS